MSLLRIDNLRKSFGSDVVLRDLTLDVPEHSATVLIGASGSGKSTLLRCINLLEDIDDGVIALDNQEISDPEMNPDVVRQKIGMVFQSFNLFPHMTVRENIELAPIKVQKKDKEEARTISTSLLKRFDLFEKAEQYPDRLSGGQQQRVAIIRSIAVNPRLLLLDEVTSALDPVLVNEVLSIVRDLKEDGMTMVIATHEMGFATQVADQVCFLDSGSIHERGTASQVIVIQNNLALVTLLIECINQVDSKSALRSLYACDRKLRTHFRPHHYSRHHWALADRRHGKRWDHT